MIGKCEDCGSSGIVEACQHEPFRMPPVLSLYTKRLSTASNTKTFLILIQTMLQGSLHLQPYKPHCKGVSHPFLKNYAFIYLLFGWLVFWIILCNIMCNVTHNVTQSTPYWTVGHLATLNATIIWVPKDVNIRHLPLAWEHEHHP
jgi:hypothetical protein